MASYWKSNPRYFCEICKCWLADNKSSKEFHERGKSHKDKKEKHLTKLRKESAEQYKNQQQAGVFLRQMEDAALQAYKKDLAERGLIIDGAMPHLASSRPSTGLGEYHFQEPQGGKKKKIKIHNAEDMRESKIVKNSSWIKQISPEGEEYYWNTETGQSQWERPKEGFTEKKIEPTDSETKDAPQDKSKSDKSPWQKQISPDGNEYYWNTETGKSQWEKPDGYSETKEGKNSKKKTEKSPWTEEVSPEGHTYYWNSETGKSQWEKPDDFTDPGLKESDNKDETSTEQTPSKRPRHNPYGAWSVVREVGAPKKVDWQLPDASSNSAKEGFVDRTSLEAPEEPEPTKFDEKIVISLGSEGGSTTFKKKTTKQRSIRKRNHDD